MKATIKIFDNGAVRLNVPNNSIAEAEINTRGPYRGRMVRFADKIYIKGIYVGGTLSEHGDDGKCGWKIVKTH